MILVGTQLEVADNSGAIRVNCIKMLGSSKCNHSKIGDNVIVSVRQAKKEKKVKKHDVCKGIIVRQRDRTYRKNGTYIYFAKNSVVLVKDHKLKDLIGNRIVGSVTMELRYKKCMKILLLAWNIL